MFTFIKIFHITHKNKSHKIYILHTIKISSNEDLAVILLNKKLCLRYHLDMPIWHICKTTQESILKILPDTASSL